MLIVSLDKVKVADQRSTPVYMQDWFTLISARNQTVKHFCTAEDPEAVGNLTLLVRRNGLGMKQAYNLPWARLGGPLISAPVGSERRTRIVRQLIKQLPADISYFLKLASASDYETFIAEGFQPMLEDNYIISADLARDPDASFSKMTRRHLRQAERELLVSTTSPASFVQLYSEHLARRRRKPYAPLSIAQALLEEGLRRGQCRITTACRRDTGEIDAAIACLWDSETYYYWMTTRRVPVSGEYRPQQGAVKLLLRAAIEDAARRGLTFDFDGAGTTTTDEPGSKARLYTGMGATLAVRYGVYRHTSLERAVQGFRAPIKSAIRNTVGRFMTLQLND